jgi:Flp pilus assembly protein TadB
MRRVVLCLPTGIAAAALVLSLLRVPRRLTPRVARYTVAARARLGDAGAEMEALLPAPAGGVFGRVLGPMFRAFEDRVVTALGQRSEAATALALEHAGLSHITPQQFRDQQFVFALFGLAVALVGGIALGPRSGVLLAFLAVPYGFLRKRIQLNRLVKARQAVMRSELWSICPLLAVKAYATPNVLTVLSEFVAEGRGEVVGELRRVLAAIHSGTAGEVALRAAAARTAEPFAARLYRTLADHLERGGEMTKALLGQAADVRHAYRDDRLRAAVARTNLMVIPAVIMATELVALIGAPSLHLLFNLN